MFRKLGAFFEAFKKGQELANAATWKNRTIAVNVLVAFLGALVTLAGVFGFDLKLEASDLEAVATGVVALVGIVNTVMHLVTSAKVGVGKLPADGGSVSGGGGEPADLATGGDVAR